MFENSALGDLNRGSLFGFFWHLIDDLGGDFLWQLEELGLILAGKSTSGIYNDFVTFFNQNDELSRDIGSEGMAEVENFLGTLDQVVLGLDDVFEISGLVVPLLADSAGLTGHHGEGTEGLRPGSEVVDESFGLSLVLGDLTLEDTGGNGVAGDTGTGGTDDTGGAATIDLGSDVFSPFFELLGLTFGGSSESVGDATHLGLDGDQLFGEDVQLFRDDTTVLVTRFEGVEEDFNGGFIDLLAAAHKHVFIVLEGNSGDHLDVLGTGLELFG